MKGGNKMLKIALLNNKGEKLEDINLDTIDKFSGDIFYNRRYVLNNFSNKNKLISNFENIIKKINIYK